MLKFELWKKILISVVIFLGLLFSIPNFWSSDNHVNLPGKTINLGLDLQGGSYLLLKVDMNTVLTERLNDILENIRISLRKEKIKFNKLKISSKKISVNIKNKENILVVKNILKPFGNDIIFKNLNNNLEISFSESGLTNLQQNTIQQSIEIIRRRLDPDGTKEPLIQQQGKDRILIQLPGIDDPERIKRLLGKTAKLTFQLVNTRVSVEDAQQRGRVPPSSVLLKGINNETPSYVVYKRVMISGEMLDTASAGFDQNNSPAVNFQLNAIGGKKFGKVTGENIGKPFAIILDGQVVSAPIIRSQIFSNGQITGNFSVEETKELSLILRAGALPAPLEVLEERSVGPGLGADSISAGKIAASIGLILVIIFMFLTYGIFGLFANVALFINIFLILGLLSVLQATLTLPGIAGIVLTMGMAVDANVLIFERIKEEIKAGRTNISAIEAGYSRAISTIIDSNLTTLFAAIFLFIFGSGPVAGFAVTLSIGILTSMFSAIMITRFLLSTWFNFQKPKVLKI